MKDEAEELRAIISKEEAIRRISLAGGEYDPTNITFDLYDQLLACETLIDSTPVDPTDADGRLILELKERKNGNSSVNGSVNGSYKRTVNFEFTQDKLDVITQLKDCNYRTPPRIVAKLLETLFKEYNSKPDHWLYIAQHWPPRPIYRVIIKILKQHTTGSATVGNHAAYATMLIKRRAPRRINE